jgi:hypothetical protein
VRARRAARYRGTRLHIVAVPAFFASGAATSRSDVATEKSRLARRLLRQLPLGHFLRPSLRRRARSANGPLATTSSART